MTAPPWRTYPAVPAFPKATEPWPPWSKVAGTVLPRPPKDKARALPAPRVTPYPPYQVRTTESVSLEILRSKTSRSLTASQVDGADEAMEMMTAFSKPRAKTRASESTPKITVKGPPPKPRPKTAGQASTSKAASVDRSRSRRGEPTEMSSVKMAAHACAERIVRAKSGASSRRAGRLLATTLVFGS